ncbi:hypothetical protein K450DRAFT_258179 [Umbelopsis ramanniana AG]|uniref:Uncharacterized protein n=1 Tax=Umbelopsis ramanniana AG TaxID=1314678 RepID=A0AAD5E224_UMBRA|nr:uncharacterized protein K450DRAFT_258179 [Umbelopsis ramanniana AG]KAI8576133.1 hypothetical protein K450DRAFT_258179 [Umbelopsis ramanniana AG]
MLRCTVLIIILYYIKFIYAIPVNFDDSQVRQLQLSSTGDINKPCGYAVVSCIALPGDPLAKPIRCGKLTKAPVCRNGSSEQCHSFCEQESGDQLCTFAFASCCSQGYDGCVATRPKEILEYNGSNIWS